jgi:hypothetical protein
MVLLTKEIAISLPIRGMRIEEAAAIPTSHTTVRRLALVIVIESPCFIAIVEVDQPFLVEIHVEYPSHPLSWRDPFGLFS